jgi:hypothetical protein
MTILVVKRDFGIPKTKYGKLCVAIVPHISGHPGSRLMMRQRGQSEQRIFMHTLSYPVYFFHHHFIIILVCLPGAPYSPFPSNSVLPGLKTSGSF